MLPIFEQFINSFGITIQKLFHSGNIFRLKSGLQSPTIFTLLIALQFGK